MAQLWKYITEIATTNKTFEDSDRVVINQGGNSVQIPWSILKSGIENKLSTINELLDSSVFTGSDEEEGYVDADVTIDAIKQDIVLINETLVNITSTLKDINTSLNVLKEEYYLLSHTVENHTNSITILENNLEAMPKITYGDVDPNTLIDDLKPKDKDVYIFTGTLTE